MADLRLSRKGRRGRVRKPVGPLLGVREFKRGTLAFADAEATVSTPEPQRNELLRKSQATIRDLRRILLFDHDQVDTVGDDWDELCDQLDQDPITDGARQELLTSIDGVELVFDADDAEDIERAKEAWKPGSERRERAIQTFVDTYTRGHTVSERTWERDEKGWDWPNLRRLYSDHYRMLEGPHGKVDGLEIRVPVGDIPPVLAGKRQMHAQYVPTAWWTLTPSGEIDPATREPLPAAWDDYRIERHPRTAKQARGRGAYLKILPDYYFSLHVAQWLKVLIERHGLPSIMAEFVGNFSTFQELAGSGYAVTEKKVFEALAKMQTAHRMLIPPGFKASELTTSAQGLAAMLVAILKYNRTRIEIGLIYQEVTSGSAASMGTQGANVTVSQTFLRLVRQMQMRFAGMVNDENRLAWLHNAVPSRPAPLASFEDPDPAAERLTFERIRAAVQDGVAAKENPVVLAAYGLEPHTEASVTEIRKARGLLGTMQIGNDMQAAQGQGRDPMAPNSVMASYEDAEATEATTRMQLRMLGATSEEIDAAIEAADQRVAADIVPIRQVEPEPGREPEKPAEPEPSTGFELTPSGTASVVTVNEARTASRLAPLSLPDGSQDPDGELTIGEFEAKRKARAEEQAQQTQPLSAAMSEARARVYRCLDALGGKLSRDDYDASRRPPITSQFEAALKTLKAREPRATAELWSDAVQGWIAHRLPQCEGAADRAELVEDLKRYVGGDLLEGVK